MGERREAALQIYKMFSVMQKSEITDIFIEMGDIMDIQLLACFSIGSLSNIANNVHRLKCFLFCD